MPPPMPPNPAEPGEPAGPAETDSIAVADRPLVERVRRVLEHLGVRRAHFAGRAPGAELFAALAAAQPDLVASVALVMPAAFDPAPLRPLAGRLLLVQGDAGPGAAVVPRVLPALPGARTVTAPDYFQMMWSDLLADRAGQVGPALLDFWRGVESQSALPPLAVAEGAGEVDGVTYEVRHAGTNTGTEEGGGPPLVLTPLGLSPSQWDPLLPALRKRYCTISLGGPLMGVVALLEQRARTGYIDVVRATVDDAAVGPGDDVLEVGCGSGAVARWLARHTGARVTGVDVNRYLLREAAGLAARDGIALTLREGSADSLPFAGASFDVTTSFTVMEEVDAERMLAEMVRVTRPGGRVAVVVRAIDVPARWLAFALRRELLDKIAAASAGASPTGCADASLYRRFAAAGLHRLRMGPRFGWTHPAPGLGEVVGGALRQMESALTAAELPELHAAIARAREDGTFFWANPYHCATGTKP